MHGNDKILNPQFFLFIKPSMDLLLLFHVNKPLITPLAFMMTGMIKIEVFHVLLYIIMKPILEIIGLIALLRPLRALVSRLKTPHTLQKINDPTSYQKVDSQSVAELVIKLNFISWILQFRTKVRAYSRNCEPASCLIVSDFPISSFDPCKSYRSM
jgi:hypothetical protein